MFNYENYGIYEKLARTGYQEINSDMINSDNIDDHIKWILNIASDGIETEEFKRMKIRMTFADNYTCSIYISYYIFNLFHWCSIVNMGDLIYSKHIFFPENITMGYTNKYINTWNVAPYYGLVDKIKLNNSIDDSLSKYKKINKFALYLCNTIDLVDDIKLMKSNKLVYDIMHCDLSGLSLEDAKAEGMRLTKQLINIIYNDPNHCFGEMFRTGVGINTKQYKENCVNVGPKPNGEGGIFSSPINSNLMYQAGLKELLYMFIEYSGGRQAQIINQKNVGNSGAFARILKLNSMDTYLNEDPNYICGTRNFLEITIKNEKLLRFFSGMTYRENKNGIDMILSETDTDMIGRTLYFRSAATCASHASGNGVCHCCYGKMAYGNSDINIGIMATELLSSVLTQMLLSAKHLLEAVIKKIVWTDGFDTFFTIDCNEVSLNHNIPGFNNYKIVINMNPDEDIFMEEDYDEVDFNKYMSNVKIETPDGQLLLFESATKDNLYLSYTFLEMIDKRSNETDDDGILKIPFKDIDETTMFLINIGNNQLSDALNHLQKILNNAAETNKYTLSGMIQTFMETVIESNISIQATHCALIISNQLRSKDDVLSMPKWEVENEDYQILTLNASLKKSFSVTKTLLYSYINELLCSPLTYRKTKPSSADLLFMPKPQEFLNNDTIIDAKKLEATKDLRPGIIMIGEEQKEVNDFKKIQYNPNR